MSFVDSDDDNKSVGSVSSTISVTNQPFQCPFCSWCKGSRGLFNHITSRHNRQIPQFVGTSQDLKSDLEDGNCLNIAHKKKDFEIFGCMACKKTFQTKARAQAHWRTNPKCRIPHTKEVQKLIRDVQEVENQKKGKEWLQALTSKELDNCIERFRRWYYRMIFNDIPWLESRPLNKGITLPEKYKHLEFKDPSHFVGKSEKLKAYLDYTSIIQNLYSYFKHIFTLDLDYQMPEPIGFEDSFEGLPPVGTSFDRTEFVLTDEAKQKKEDEFRLKLEEEYNKRAKELQLQQIELHKKLLELADKEKALEVKQIEEKKPMEPIVEETIGQQPKQKRNSFTIPKPNPSDFIFRSTSPTPQSYPQIIANTKTKREPKRVPPV